jgi:small GTP-binding protein
MTPIVSKVCLVGDFAVGKTSVAERYVNNHFSEKYLTTVGVKIDTREMEIPDLGVTHKLVIWDIAGSDRFDETQMAYLRGASGVLYVADGTRSDTLRSLVYLKEQISDRHGGMPSIALVNKTDLTTEWEIDDGRVAELGAEFDGVFKTSAKTGEAVEEAIATLSRRILEADLRAV